jgi:hypothetical protein
MANIIPNIGTPNASLSSPLITPGYPMVVVPQSNPVAEVVAKESPTAAHDLVAASPTLEKARVQSGHSNNRSL